MRDALRRELPKECTGIIPNSVSSVCSVGKRIEVPFVANLHEGDFYRPAACVRIAYSDERAPM